MVEYTPEEILEHRKLWVAALRSGQYSQAKGALKKHGAYCCLGVACDVSGVGRWSNEVFVDNEVYGEERVPDAQGGSLTVGVKRWLGASSRGGAPFKRDTLPINLEKDVPFDIHTLDVSTLNDACGFSFERIADFVERYPDLAYG